MVSIPNLEDYDVSFENGFLPSTPPLQSLPNPYYAPWETVMKNLQGLLLSKRLRETVDKLPILSTRYLEGAAQWRRAYSVLAFITHGYIWAGPKPQDRIPPAISIPFLATCKQLQLPPVATYAGLVLWNWKPIFNEERVDTLANLDTLETFTGSLDEKWFYLVSIAIELRGAPIIPTMLRAIRAASEGDAAVVVRCLQSFAERLSELRDMLAQMHENCDPHVFYYRIRPYLAGSKNMAEAGLPQGVIFDNGGAVNRQRYVQYSGGSNAQSSIIQFFDIVLGVEHHPTVAQKDAAPQAESKTKSPKPGPNFIHEMRKYMPGQHARFLQDVEKVANIRSFVEQRSYDRGLTIAYDACLAMLRGFRDTHIQIVSRYIIIKSREAKTANAEEPSAGKTGKIDLAYRVKPANGQKAKQDLKGTGGTSLIPFLRQARDETGEPAVDAWTQRLLRKDRALVQGDTDAEKIAESVAWFRQAEANGGGLCYS